MVITDIGDGADGTSPLICATTYTDHVVLVFPIVLESGIYSPDKTTVPNIAAGQGYYRGRGNNGTACSSE